MRTLLVAALALVGSTACAQFPVGQVMALGPWQPNPYGGPGFYYSNPTYGYRGPVGYAPTRYYGGYGGYGAGYDDDVAYEIRQLRTSMEQEAMTARRQANLRESRRRTDAIYRESQQAQQTGYKNPYLDYSRFRGR